MVCQAFVRNDAVLTHFIEKENNTIHGQPISLTDIFAVNDI